MISTEFLLTSLVVVLIPGTGVIYTVSAGLFMDPRASTAAAFGCTMGIIPHLLASVLGLATLLHMSALAFQAFKLAGAAYLIYLAWSIWRETGALKFDKPENVGVRTIALRGLLINILNPKLSIFFLAFLPQFVAPGSTTPIIQMLLLSVIFMAMTLIIFILYGLSAGRVRNMVINSPKTALRLQKSFAAVFAFLGVRLALSES